MSKIIISNNIPYDKYLVSAINMVLKKYNALYIDEIYSMDVLILNIKIGTYLLAIDADIWTGYSISGDSKIVNMLNNDIVYELSKNKDKQ